jgi:hypothetical protein
MDLQRAIGKKEKSQQVKACEDLNKKVTGHLENLTSRALTTECLPFSDSPDHGSGYKRGKGESFRTLQNNFDPKNPDPLLENV